MVESSVVREYTLNRLANLSEVLDKKNNGYTIDDFHDLRVEIKKLNAISGILKFSHRKFKRKKFIRPYKKLFSIAGRIREAQLETALFEELQLTSSLAGYIKNKNSKIGKDNTQFEKQAKALRKKIGKDGRSLDAGFHKTTREKVYRFSSLLNYEVISMINKGNWSNEELHELRKKLKELLYTISIFRIAGTEYKSIDALQDLIGKWHDKVVMEDQLSRKKLLQKIKKQERITMKLAVEYLHHSSVEMFHNICSEIGKYQSGKGLTPAVMQQEMVRRKKLSVS